MTGRRVKLDLSDFVTGGGARRWMYLSDDKMSTVSDIVDRLREEYSQLGEGDRVTLYLDNYELPDWEDINIVQS